jgi:DNA-binding transcriptional ArsR family regulator
MNNGTERLARVLKVLGDANRLSILRSLGKKARSVTEIINATGLSQTLVSFHLRSLRDADIVKTRRDGPFVYYRLSDPALLDLLLSLSKATGYRRAGTEETTIPVPAREGEKKRRA